MSANRDKGQRFTFLYSNLYQIHQNQKKEAESKVAIPSRSPTAQAGSEDSRIIKVGDLKSGTIAKHYQVTEYAPTELLGKKSELSQNRQRLLNEMPKNDKFRPSDAVSGLKSRLQELKDLHSKLRFMLTELEDLTKK